VAGENGLHGRGAGCGRAAGGRRGGDRRRGHGQPVAGRRRADGRPAWSARANLEQPDAVRRVHEDYIRAGAEVIIANTYAANPAALEPARLGGQVAEVNLAAHAGRAGRPLGRGPAAGRGGRVDVVVLPGRAGRRPAWRAARRGLGTDLVPGPGRLPGAGAGEVDLQRQHHAE